MTGHLKWLEELEVVLPRGTQVESFSQEREVAAHGFVLSIVYTSAGHVKAPQKCPWKERL
jgi:hypothetical protein